MLLRKSSRPPIGDSARFLRVAMWPADNPGLANPYTALLTRVLRGADVRVEPLRWPALLHRRYDLVHVHWPERLITGGTMRHRVAMVTALTVAKRRGAKVVWTVHNLASRDTLRSRPRAWAWDAFTRLVDGYFSLTPSGIAAARDRYPRLAGKPAFLVSHGHYRAVYPPGPGRTQAREALGLADASTVLLTFGLFRRYKGFRRLTEVFAAWPDNRAALIVAGAPYDPVFAAELREAAAADRRIVLLDRSIDDAETVRLFAAADVVVLPYLDVLNSGVAILALSLDRAIVGPDKGAFPDLHSQLGETWVRIFAEPLDLERLRRACEEPALPAEGERCDLTAFEWDAVRRGTLDGYERLLGTD